MFTTANAVDWVTGEEWVYNGTWYGSYPTYLATQECMQMMVTHGDPAGLWKQAMCSTVAVYVCEEDIV